MHMHEISMLPAVKFLDYHALSPSLQDQFKELHSILLPVRYGEAFYHNLLTKRDRISLVAVVESAEDQNQGACVVGFVTGRIKNYGECCTTCTGYVMTLGTSNDFRGKGIGGRLLDVLIVRLQDLGAVHIELHCTTTNEAAIALYVSRGFTLIQKLEEHYHFHEKLHDAFFFSLKGTATLQGTCQTWCSSFVMSLHRYCCGWQ